MAADTDIPCVSQLLKQCQTLFQQRFDATIIAPRLPERTESQAAQRSRDRWVVSQRPADREAGLMMRASGRIRIAAWPRFQVAEPVEGGRTDECQSRVAAREQAGQPRAPLAPVPAHGPEPGQRPG